MQSYNPTRSGTVYKVNLVQQQVLTQSSTGLKAAVADMQAVTIRNSRAFRFENVNDVAPNKTQAQRLCLMNTQMQFTDQ